MFRAVFLLCRYKKDGSSTQVFSEESLRCLRMSLCIKFLLFLAFLDMLDM